MKSNSKNRVPKFAPMTVSGPQVQTNPLVWTPKVHGFPYWFNREGFFGKAITPFVSAAARAEASRDQYGGFNPPTLVEMEDFECLELRARANPWHPNGRLERLVLKKLVEEKPGVYKRYLIITLKFHGPDEQVELLSAYTIREIPKTTAPAKVHVFDPKYKGPRLAGDTKSAVSGNKRKP